MLTAATEVGGGNEAQMTLEQHGFEMTGPLIHGFFFNSKYYSHMEFQASQVAQC